MWGSRIQVALVLTADALETSFRQARTTDRWRTLTEGRLVRHGIEGTREHLESPGGVISS